jgi:hypothetical protein
MVVSKRVPESTPSRLGLLDAVIEILELAGSGEFCSAPQSESSKRQAGASRACLRPVKTSPGVANDLLTRPVGYS